MSLYGLLAMLGHRTVEEFAWMKQGSCRSVPSQTMFPKRGETAKIARAKLICAGCPVLTTCRTYAIETTRAGADTLGRVKLSGVWGGTTGRERERLVGKRHPTSSKPIASTTYTQLSFSGLPVAAARVEQ